MEKLKYQISSRATILLGRESVSKVDGAIIEMVKNTYDADANFCYICFDIENDHIYILDNGTGMTKNIIESYWMMIGTDNKREEYLSSKDRIKSGEKGIGRFALDRLGSKCTMYTKNENEQLIYWYNDWSSFECPGKTLDEIEADFSYVDKSFIDIIPESILINIKKQTQERNMNLFQLERGTIFEISGLRDKWTKGDIQKIVGVLGFLVPPVEQKEYSIFIQNNLQSESVEVVNDITEEYDYKIKAHFNGKSLDVTIYRNEFDLNVMPKELFRNQAFSTYPYRLEDFIKNNYTLNLSIPELTGNSNEDFLAIVNSIGEFDFQYIFMKITAQEGPYYYKPVSQKRRIWLTEHGGIKIYRDNFIVRPYGDPDSNAYDWLGLDAKKGINPVAISDKSGQWHVNNSQSQGTVLISRVHNFPILDKSSREGIIENEYFSAFSILLMDIINLFERDRAYIVRNIKMYLDKINAKEQTKTDAQNIAKAVLRKNNRSKKLNHKEEKASKLAEAVQIFQEEREELISEIKLLRALATNGLMTTSMVHDLKTINALLVSRVRGLRIAIRDNDTTQIERNLNDLFINDEFLKSWITVITTQSNKDRRRRLKKDLCQTINESLKMLKPILDRKQVVVNFSTDESRMTRRIFESDFDSIIYNLIINSIESFEETKCDNRVIDIYIETSVAFIIHYYDNGHGLSEAFLSNPYKIFEYGTTSKFDPEGNQTGTGLGMYIVASSINEYNGRYNITKVTGGFGVDIIIPFE